MLMVATMKRETKKGEEQKSPNAGCLGRICLDGARCLCPIGSRLVQSFLSTLSTTPHYFYNHPVVAVQQKRPVSTEILTRSCWMAMPSCPPYDEKSKVLQIATTFENVTVDYDNEVTPRSRSCSCATLLQSMNLMNQDLAATKARLNGLTTQFGGEIFEPNQIKTFTIMNSQKCLFSEY
ncbi:hypothetical protein OUZ56_015493 [Daphnia magna]|uniref:Uncharacterized protein n=1 Tax=Daphnia magna TaxID=35525 RepID=A0ABR0AN01_9CRUS|nr:hypothetical protein OUZ56_015493 [Daphnia magna]